MVKTTWYFDISENELYADNLLIFSVLIGDVLYTEDESELTPDCVDMYYTEMLSQSSMMLTKIGEMLGASDLCNNDTVTNIVSTASFSSFGSSVSKFWNMENLFHYFFTNFD